MLKVLVADKLAQDCLDRLEGAGIEVINRPGLSPEELRRAVKGVHGVIVRSGARLVADVLEAGDKLQAICRAGVGVDNIDVEAATRKGVVVMNTPGANTISTAEHTFALLLALSRNVAPAYISMRQDKWDRKKLTGVELAGTVLGIVGLGRVGMAVARRAAAFGMKLIGYDPFISRQAAAKAGVPLVDELAELLEQCDYLTVHVPGGETTKGLIGEKQIAMMKPEARIINCARGDVVDQEAVVKAVSEGRLAGAAFDVYTSEPPENYDFARNDRILATPHLAASTEAAQKAVGVQAAEQMMDALLRGYYRNALNMTSVPSEEMALLRPYCELARCLGKAAGVLNRGRPKSLQVSCRGELAQHNTMVVANYGIVGVLQSVLGNLVNIVSAPHLAEERGLHVTVSSSGALEAGFTDLVVLELTTEAGALEVAGTVFGRQHPRIVRIGPFHTEVIPEGHLLMLFGQDKPGQVGSVGEVLGRSGVNIARMTFSRTRPAGESLVALNLDGPCDQETLESIGALPSIHRTALLSL